MADLDRRAMDVMEADVAVTAADMEVVWTCRAVVVVATDTWPVDMAVDRRWAEEEDRRRLVDTTVAIR